MAKRMNGAGVNRSAARKASEVAALRLARLAAHEAAVTDLVAVFFDRSGRAAGLRDEARLRAARVLADADTAAGGLESEADGALVRLRRLDEPVAEIAVMTGQSVGAVRAALARANGRPPGDVTDPGGPPPVVTSQVPRPDGRRGTDDG